MLPSLRLILTATLTTFLVTAAIGLLASLRFAQEPLTARTDMRASIEDLPISRVSLTLPEPAPRHTAAATTKVENPAAHGRTAIRQRAPTRQSFAAPRFEQKADKANAAEPFHFFASSPSQ